MNHFLNSWETVEPVRTIRDDFEHTLSAQKLPSALASNQRLFQSETV